MMMTKTYAKLQSDCRRFIWYKVWANANAIVPMVCYCVRYVHASVLVVDHQNHDLNLKVRRLPTKDTLAGASSGREQYETYLVRHILRMLIPYSPPCGS
jgi:hypothetical protein